MISLKKLAVLIGIVSAASLTTMNASAYTMGPYINAAVGGSFFDIPNFFSNNDDYTASSVAGRLGLGYIAAFTQTENPFFWGVEGNGNYYSFSESKLSLYGADLSALLGKQLSNEVGIYGKLGATVIGKNGHNNGTLYGPQVGAGLGYQLTNNLRITGEGDYAITNSTVQVSTVMLGLQYSF